MGSSLLLQQAQAAPFFPSVGRIGKLGAGERTVSEQNRGMWLGIVEGLVCVCGTSPWYSPKFLAAHSEAQKNWSETDTIHDSKEKYQHPNVGLGTMIFAA